MYHSEAKSFPWAISTYGIRVALVAGGGGELDEQCYQLNGGMGEERNESLIHS
jgi:hypothetical protein